MAGAGKSLGPKEAGFLDVATYTLAGILLFFLVVSLTFERVSAAGPVGAGACATYLSPRHRMQPRHPAYERVAAAPKQGPDFLKQSCRLQSTQWLMRYLKKRKRNGLAQAVSNLVLELTLVGLVSLLLIVLQDPIANICGKRTCHLLLLLVVVVVVPGSGRRLGSISPPPPTLGRMHPCMLNIVLPVRHAVPYSSSTIQQWSLIG